MSSQAVYYLSLPAAAVLTVLLETPVCVLLLRGRVSRGYVLRLSVLVNLLTNIFINWIGIPLLSLTSLWSLGNGLFCIALLELLFAYLAEGCLYARYIPGLPRGRAALASLAANSLSLGLGHVVYAWLNG